MSCEYICTFASNNEIVEFTRVWPSPIDIEPPVFYLTIRPDLEDEDGQSIILTPEVIAQFVDGFNEVACAKKADVGFVVYEESFR